MTPAQIDLVQTSWKLVKPLGSQAGMLFYQHLFTHHPQLRPLFKGELEEQASKLIKMLSWVVGNLSNPDLGANVQALGIRHAGYAVEPGHYDAVGSSLLAVLEAALGEEWNDDLQKAWATAYGTLAEIMIEAQKGVTNISA